MSWRRLRVLIQHLPPESHTMTALRNAMTDEELAGQAEQGEPERDRWSKVEQLIAVVADRVARVEYVLICANTEKRRDRPALPEPLRRPGAKPPTPKPMLTDESRDFLFNLINGRAA